MKDDYLWDPSATPDPEVQRLEQLLGRLRTQAPAPHLPVRLPAPRFTEGKPDATYEIRLKPDATYVPVRLPAPRFTEGKADATYETDETNDESIARVRWRTVRFLAPALAAAAAIILMVTLTWRTAGKGASWDVARISGAPRIGSGTLAGEGRLAVGQTLVTDATSQARLQVGTIGEVTVDPDTHVRLVDTRDGHHRLALTRGTLHAVITAPPGQFIVSTPSADATDLGCAYTLHVDEDGAGLLSVVQGWVALAFNGLESFVPAGASCRTDPTRGPGTPRYDDGAEALRNALDEFDDGGDAARRAAALRFVLDHPDTSAVTLWHLIPRVGAADRGAVVDALADQLAIPPGVTREAILRLDRAALDAWWNELGLGDASWWRQWKSPMSASR